MTVRFQDFLKSIYLNHWRVSDWGHWTNMLWLLWKHKSDWSHWTNIFIIFRKKYNFHLKCAAIGAPSDMASLVVSRDPSFCLTWGRHIGATKTEEFCWVQSCSIYKVSQSQQIMRFIHIYTTSTENKKEKHSVWALGFELKQLSKDVFTFLLCPSRIQGSAFWCWWCCWRLITQP